MDDTDKTKHPEPVVDLPRKVTVKSIPERRDEYHIAIATLLGCVIAQPKGYAAWRYETPGRNYSSIPDWSLPYSTPAMAARAWLMYNDHNLNGWQDEEDEATPQR